MVSVHCSFGLALHMGQRTERMCRNVSVSGLIVRVFDIILPRDELILPDGTYLCQCGERAVFSPLRCALFDLFQRHNAICRNG